MYICQIVHIAGHLKHSFIFLIYTLYYFRRQYKIFKDRTSASAYFNDIGGVEAAPPENGNRQRPAQQARDRELGPNHCNEPNLAGTKRMPGQQGRAGMRKPNRRYDPMETTSPQNVQVHETAFVNYDSPLDSMRASGAYEIPTSKPVNSKSQINGEREQKL